MLPKKSLVLVGLGATAAIIGGVLLWRRRKGTWDQAAYSAEVRARNVQRQADSDALDILRRTQAQREGRSFASLWAQVQEFKRTRGGQTPAPCAAGTRSWTLANDVTQFARRIRNAAQSAEAGRIEVSINPTRAPDALWDEFSSLRSRAPRSTFTECVADWGG